MKQYFFVDVLDHEDGDASQYGVTCETHEEAMVIFAEAVHAYCLDDEWNGIAGVADGEHTSIVVREISVPQAN